MKSSVEKKFPFSSQTMQNMKKFYKPKLSALKQFYSSLLTIFREVKHFSF